MANLYLEKVANALTRAIARGAVTSVSTVARNGSKMGASALNKVITGASPTGLVRTPSVRNSIGSLGKANGLKFAKSPARDVVSGDALARSSIKTRLASNKADILSGKVKKPASKSVFGNSTIKNTKVELKSSDKSTNSFLEKAKSFIETNPKLSTGAGIAGAGVLGHAIGKKRGENQFQQY